MKSFLLFWDRKNNWSVFHDCFYVLQETSFTGGKAVTRKVSTTKIKNQPNKPEAQVVMVTQVKSDNVVPVRKNNKQRRVVRRCDFTVVSHYANCRAKCYHDDNNSYTTPSPETSQSLDRKPAKSDNKKGYNNRAMINERGRGDWNILKAGFINRTVLVYRDYDNFASSESNSRESNGKISRWTLEGIAKGHKSL